MGLALLKQRKELVSINPNFASSAVILAYPNERLFSLASRLKSIRAKGYDPHHLFRPQPYKNEPFYSSYLNEFIGKLEGLGFTHDRFVNASSLTPRGRGLLEGSILSAFIENANITRRFLGDLGYDLDSLLQKYLERHFELIRSR